MNEFDLDLKVTKAAGVGWGAFFGGSDPAKGPRQIQSPTTEWTLNRF
ncbi:hypothetical protein [Actinoallomurus sp. CA-142502]